MKKVICLLLALLTMLAVIGCESGTGDTPSSGSQEGTGEEPGEMYDVDLTKLSSTMVYAEVNNMMTKPEDYLGKTVKMRGNFSVYHDDATGKYYFACLIADATACCSQGIEFVLEGERNYPDDYPTLGSVITVAGTFDTYYEGAYRYCQLINAQLQ